LTLKSNDSVSFKKYFNDSVVFNNFKNRRGEITPFLKSGEISPRRIYGDNKTPRRFQNRRGDFGV
jgi:hypothetical protein